MALFVEGIMEGLREIAWWIAEFIYNIVHGIDTRDDATKARDAERVTRTAARETRLGHVSARPVDAQKEYFDTTEERRRQALREQMIRWDGSPSTDPRHDPRYR